MEFDNTFAVNAPIDEVWDAMLDVERVAPCMPGARVIEKTGENAYKVGIKVKLGPMSMTYTGNVEITEADAGAHRALMSASAKEARGQGTANATVELRLAQSNGRTEGTMHSEVAMSGRAAAMGQGVIGDVSAKMIETFAENLAQMLSGPAESPPSAPADDALSASAIVADVAAHRARNPRVIAIAAALFFVIFLLWRRSRT
jgi:carbon monoxide dehydrogenase subunit G